MPVLRQVALRFAVGGSVDDAPSGLSAVVRDGPWLWVAGDESPRLDRLRVDPSDDGCYADHRSFPLGDLVDLPEGRLKEVDVEGLDRSGGYLWLIGSHSRTRKQVKPGDSDDEAVDHLAQVRSHPNRQVLLRLPVADEPDGARPVPASTTVDGEQLTAAFLGVGEGGLVDALSSDEHLAPFLAVPGKDNGLDVEGIVVLEDAILLGLRGPVLRGWAVVLELRLRDAPGQPGRLLLRSGGSGYRKYFLDLDGLGVRDLCRLGDDVLLLAGPTMDLDGPMRLYRWNRAALGRDRSVVRGEQLSRLEDLPFGARENEGRDHAEGITVLPDRGSPSALVVYDSPTRARDGGDGVVLADVVGLPV
jgi:hypothetical protein